ncbi:MAG TPA: hypothetical protein PKN56_09595 [Leptospiraceae bacterium]|nr:hypothetical protein [Leptospiraceae bacterium]HMY65650.1 hypothetical protein [Leptospiraceae bacterium]HNN03805.1 hypothetical protein [Leptospiraceae bacterium]
MSFWTFIPLEADWIYYKDNMIHKILISLILAVLSSCVTVDRSSQAVNLNAEDAKKKMILEKFTTAANCIVQ